MQTEKLLFDKKICMQKWQPIINGAYPNLNKSMVEKLCLYADKHNINESLSVVHSGNIETQLLPLALKTLTDCEILKYLSWNVRPFSEEVMPSNYKVTADYTQGRRDNVESIENHLSSSIADKISEETVDLMFKLGEINNARHNNGLRQDKIELKDDKEYLNKMRTYILGENFKLSKGSSFIICNPLFASLMLSHKEYKEIAPLSKCITMNRVYLCGTFYGCSILVNPNMLNTDLRVLFGSDNEELHGGLIFEPMFICSNMSTILNDMTDVHSTKIELYSSYRFHSGSENSPSSYMVVDFVLDPENFI